MAAIKVRATRVGYYMHRRRYPGDVFFLVDDKDDEGKIKNAFKVNEDTGRPTGAAIPLTAAQAFAPSWMEKVVTLSAAQEKKAAEESEAAEAAKAQKEADLAAKPILTEEQQAEADAKAGQVAAPKAAPGGPSIPGKETGAATSDKKVI